LYLGCGLTYPFDWRGFVGTKKKTGMGLLVFIPRLSGQKFVAKSEYLDVILALG
jgi:hypothetical protein